MGGLVVYFRLPSSLLFLSLFFFFDSSLHINSCVYSIPPSYGLFCGRCAGGGMGHLKRDVSLFYTITKGVETVYCVPANYFSSSHQPSAAFFPSGISLSTLRAFLLAPPFFPSLVSHLAPSFSLCFSFFPFCPLAGLKTEPECRLES